jgi:CrcB protein
MLCVGLGAFFGANLRYAAARLLARWVGAGTFFVNVTGSLLLAVFLTWVSRRLTVSPEVRLLVATGFFGSYTTFSSFANEGVALARDGRWASAAFYILGTNIVCVVGVLVGIWLGSRI